MPDFKQITITLDIPPDLDQQFSAASNYSEALSNLIHQAHIARTQTPHIPQHILRCLNEFLPDWQAGVVSTFYASELYRYQGGHYWTLAVATQAPEEVTRKFIAAGIDAASVPTLDSDGKIIERTVYICWEKKAGVVGRVGYNPYAEMDRKQLLAEFKKFGLSAPKGSKVEYLRIKLWHHSKEKKLPPPRECTPTPLQNANHYSNIENP